MHTHTHAHIHTHITHTQCIFYEPTYIIETTLSTLLHCAGDVAWDWINNKLYWTDNAEQEIEVYDLTNAYRRVLLYTGNTSAPIGIVVDPQNR